MRADARALSPPALLPRRSTINSLLDAIADGSCAGGVAPDAVIKHALGPDADAEGAYCNLETVGPLLNAGTVVGCADARYDALHPGPHSRVPFTAAFYAIPFNPRIASSVISGLNTLALQLLANGSYTAAAAANFPEAAGRTQCEAAAPELLLAPGLSLTDMSGVFFVQALGLVAAFAIVGALRLLHAAGYAPGPVVAGMHHWRQWCIRPAARRGVA